AQLRTDDLPDPALAPVAARAKAARAWGEEALRPALERGPPVATVAREHLVPSFARQYHFQLGARMLGQERGRQARVVVEEVVGGPDGVGKAPEHRPAVEHDLGVLGAEVAGD